MIATHKREGYLLEVITPGRNQSMIGAARHFIEGATTSHDAGARTGHTTSFEIATTHTGHHFYLRAGSEDSLFTVENQVSAAYPQAETADVYECVDDPAFTAPDEKRLTTVLRLARGEWLPLRTLSDRDLNSKESPQTDPITNVLRAGARLEPGWRVLSQLVLRSAPTDWSRSYQKWAEPPSRDAHSSGRGAGQITLLAIVGSLAASLAFGLEPALALYRQHSYAPLGLMAVGVVLWVLVLSLTLWKVLHKGPPPPPELVREKLSARGCEFELRISVIAPTSADDSRMLDTLRRQSSVYGAFEWERGNGLNTRLLDRPDTDLREVGFLSGATPQVVNTVEAANLWHLPRMDVDISELGRTGPRRQLPPRDALTTGTHIGSSSSQNVSLPVRLPLTEPRPNYFLHGGTRQGKSTLMSHLALEAMEDLSRCLLVVDPHSAFARTAAGLVSGARAENAAYIRLGDTEAPVGLNLVDADMGWSSPDKQVADVLKLFQFDAGDSWGSRMEPVFRYGLRTLLLANHTRLAKASRRGGQAARERARDEQYTLLDLPLLYNSEEFVRGVLEDVPDATVRTWWETSFLSMDKRMKKEHSSPVQNKIDRFAGTLTGRMIIGQPRSTVNPREWLRNRSVVLIDTDQSAIGENLSALLGAAFVNLLTLAAVEDARAGSQVPLSLIVDEFQDVPGGNYEGILSEMAKFSVSLVLSTQSLSTLRRVDSTDHRRYLDSAVLANTDRLFVFKSSVSDAERLAPELGAPITEDDIARLSPLQCYARVNSPRGRVPSFFCQIALPEGSRPETADRLESLTRLRMGTSAATASQLLQEGEERRNALSVGVKDAGECPAKTYTDERVRAPRAQPSKGNGELPKPKQQGKKRKVAEPVETAPPSGAATTLWAEE